MVSGSTISMIWARCRVITSAGWPPGRLAAVRKHELRASLAALDVTEHHLLGLADGALAALGEERVRQWWSTETFVAAGAARARAAPWGTWRVAA